MLELARPASLDRASLATRAFAALLLSCAACAGGQLPVRCERSDSIALHVHPSTRLNPDRAGFSRSVVLRLYQLGDTRGFSARSFESLWNEPLSGSRAQQLIAIPGRGQAHALPRDPRATHLAAIANFREHRTGTRWRALVRLPDTHTSCASLPAGRAAPIELTLWDYGLQLR